MWFVEPMTTPTFEELEKQILEQAARRSGAQGGAS